MEEEKQSGGGKKWFLGCCGGLVVLAILCAGGSWFGAGWAKDEAASQMREGIAEMLDKSELSEQQSTGINAQAERLELAIKSWGIVEALEHMGNLEQVGQQVGELAIHAVLVSYENFILPNTPMPEEERAAGRRLLQRYARGIDEGTLVMNQNDDGWNFNGGQANEEEIEFDVEEVRAHLAKVKIQVEAAGIPDEPYEVDLADKLKTIVDAMLDE